MSNKTKAVFGVVAVVIFGAGFLAGMEYKAYQIRSALTDAFSGIADVFGEESMDETKETTPEVSNDLTKKVGFEITKKGFVSGSYQDQITFTFKLSNNSGKDIEGVKGTINLQDIFGDSIKQSNFSYDEGIKAGESKLYEASLDYNQFIDADIKLRQTDLTKLTYEWSVNTIIYEDGTQESF